MPDLAHAQRGGRGGGGGGQRGGGATVRSAPVGRAVPRGGQPVYRGGAYRGGYRGVYRGAYGVRPVYWGGLGLGYGWGGWGGWGGGWGGWGAWGPGWWGPGFASSMWWPGFGWWGGPALYAPPFAAWGITSDARFLVTPRSAEVYVDGALAGIVDQYDGVFQSLTLAPGTHRISLYLEGHRRHDANVYVAPGSTLKLRHTMEPLAAGAPQDERPMPPPRAQQTAVSADADPGAMPQGTEPQGLAPGAPEAPRQPREPREPREPRSIAGEAGLLVIRVQPVDAEVFIDGQRWQTPDDSRPLEVRVPPGRVRVEVRKPGFAPFSTDVTVQPGQVTPLNVSLPSRGEQL
ncbi:PEGA domain-containing protein [Luteitalea sp.]|uniref:PEGA domain-containing protein n=1 Tax=Luteitalea sp. TaxID=2004800 RepID=UPI0025C387DC|nr:PEGA domain-containing protein [Luteitalea sp.]